MKVKYVIITEIKQAMSANVLLTESMSLEVGAQEPWPSNVQLFQPYEVTLVIIQMILVMMIMMLHRLNKSYCLTMPPAWQFRPFFTWLGSTSP